MKKSLNKILILITFLTVSFFVGSSFNFDVARIQAMFDNIPLVVSGIIFVLFYVGLTTFIIVGPKDVLRISGAIIFGPFVSTLFVWLGEIGNATVLFHLSRRLGREYVQERFKIKTRDMSKKHGMGFLGIFALRINPMVPFRIMDLSFGLSNVDFRKYIIACLIGSIPRILWLQYIIHGVGESFFDDIGAMKDYFLENQGVLVISFFYFLIIAIVSLIAMVSGWIRKRKLLKEDLKLNQE
ncbi:MAG: putative membrane protein YdjX (TVP38/TMEM64 family) [Lysobacterales bacterium]|jgi:uncharacterized membrane protein YdjX (TVP38/TMEM64 family)